MEGRGQGPYSPLRFIQFHPRLPIPSFFLWSFSSLHLHTRPLSLSYSVEYKTWFFNFEENLCFLICSFLEVDGEIAGCDQFGGHLMEVKRGKSVYPQFFKLIFIYFHPSLAILIQI